MTVETEERSAVSEVFKVELEGMSSLSLSLCEDLPKGSVDCNGIMRNGAEEFKKDEMEATDSSYAPVGGADTFSDDPVGSDPPAERLIESFKSEEIVSELNFSSPNEDKQTEVDELSGGEEENGQSCMENGCHSEEWIISSSNFDGTTYGLQDEPNEDELDRSNVLEEQIKIDSSAEVACFAKIPNEDEVERSDVIENLNIMESAAMVEGNQESLFVIMENVEHKLLKIDDEEEAEDEALEGNQESLVVGMKDVEHKLLKLDDEEENAEVEKVEDNQESLVAGTDDVEHQLLKLDDGEKAEVEEVEDNQESLVVGTEDVEHQLLKHDDEEKAEVEEVEDNQESLVAGTDNVEHQLPKLDDEEKAEIEEVEDNQESLVAGTEDVEHQLLKLDDEEKAEVEEVEDNQESLVACTEDVEHQLLRLDDEEKAEVEENQESQVMDIEAGEPKLHQLTNGMEKFKDRMKSDLDDYTESPTTVVHFVESNFHQLTNGEEKVKVESEIESAPDVENNHKSEVTSSEAVESKLDQLFNGEHQEMEKVVDGIPLEEPLEDLGIELEMMVKTVPCSVNHTESETDGRNSSDDSEERLPPCPVKDIVLETEIINDPAKDYRIELAFGSINWNDIKAKGLPIASVNDTEIEANALNPSNGRNEDSLHSSVDASNSDIEVGTGSVEGGESISTAPVNDVEIGSESGDFSVASSGDTPNVITVVSESEVQNGPFENGECVPNSVTSAIDIGTGGYRCSKQILQDVEGFINIHKDQNVQSLCEGSTADALDGQHGEVEKRSFHYLIRVPRYVDDKSSEEIRLAQLQVDEKTQSRDAVRASIQVQRATCSECRDKFEASRTEERIARDALNAKRQEIDSIQSLINRMKNATSLEDIDKKIHNVEHMIEHETMSLKEEKQLIREMKQLKHLREQLSSNIGNQPDLQQALDNRDGTEERFKLLKKELDSLRNEVFRIEANTKASKKKYFDENEKLKELQVKFKAADNFRQEAYTHFQNIRKEVYEKNKYFRMYRDKAKMAHDYASSGDREALQHLCVDQVETIMELWNKNDEFRNDYIRCNMLSTIRRLRTLDGRSLGPDEEPPVLPKFANDRVDNAVLASSKSTLAVSNSEQEKSPPAPLGPEKADAESKVKGVQKNRIVVSKMVTKITSSENHSEAVSSREDRENEAEVLRKKEEEELARREDELRKEEAAAKLKEQRRLEEKAKAKEAEDRKKRKAEKAHARAELRAQKEAELKEKEREKRAKKKERKKAGASDTTNDSNEVDLASKSENTTVESNRESDMKEKPTTVLKRTQKASTITKPLPLPPPLRNKGKRKMQSWMWFLLLTLFVIALFLVGNSGFAFKSGRPSFGF